MSAAGSPSDSASRGRQYVCPGESYPISRAVHLARLASFFPACRTCAFRTDTGSLSASVVEQLEQTSQRTEQQPLFQQDGVRGIVLNRLTRPAVSGMVAALAACLWDDAPSASGPAGASGTRPRRPVVIVGHDERPTSPLLVTAVADTLRRMSCQVIDVSLTTWPCFRFAVEHLEADGGILVTGAGRDPAWNGLEFVLAGATPLSYGNLPALPAAAIWKGRTREPAGSGNTAASPALKISAGPAALPGIPVVNAAAVQGRGAAATASEPPDPTGGLNRIAARATESFSRPARSAGPQESFLAAVPYEAGLWKHFHALRPLKVICGSPLRLVRQTLSRLFEKLPCDLELLELPVRERNVQDARDADLLRVGAAVRQHNGHLGLVIDDDGARCGFLDENGHHVPADDVLRVIVHRLLVEHPGAAIVLEPSDSRALPEVSTMSPEVLRDLARVDGEAPPDSSRLSLKEFVEFSGGITVNGGSSQEEMDRLMRRSSAIAGGGSSGRVWLREGFPVCDAVLTLARVLGSLSREDLEFSKLAARLRRPSPR